MGRRWPLTRVRPIWPGPTRRRGFIEGGIETQSGNEGDRTGHGLTEIEQVEGSVAAVGDHDDVSVGQPET